ncbi:hypothetical protein NN3_39230 [Nocardia neocaledoniensis NBRC 108232]|uniref:Uncharacterized protein n=1 Tax=Nocardia neocaledoniensis TaxID=236511 RepID=A0A317NH08_9NOCA|nr:hypothetical protein [Nocardia neocaledoniensis]PWV74330.1 hypothetical protein DFR69_106141 [Nocardia neocaledoniensis]GEM32916.1 hypothetical protein NN3_39230 [Nocardia neocaledoniensis NBRC 108232]
METDDAVFVLVAAALLTWFLVSVICQIPRNLERWEAGTMQQWFRARDVLGLLPRWHFFAPVPATDNLHLLYRDRMADGQLAPWREIGPRRPAKCVGALWHPGRRQNKALIDITLELLQAGLSLDGDADRIQTTLPYIALLNFVCSLPRDHRPYATQFLVMRSKGSDENPEHQVLFVSAMHPGGPAVTREVASRC